MSEAARKHHRGRKIKSIPPEEEFFQGVYDWCRLYQRAWMADKSRLRIALKARRVGWSTTFAIESISGSYWFGRDQLIISASERQSKENLDKCKEVIEAIRESGLPVALTSDSVTELKFQNGGKVLSLPQSPRAIRGFTGDIWLDEFAFHSKDKAIYGAAFPIAAHGGGRLSIASTGLGESGLFWEIWGNKERYPDFSRHRVDIYEAMSQGLELDLELIRRNTDEESFRQEYLCQFIDDSTSYFPWALIRGCVGDGAETGGMSYLGADFGRRRDNTVIYVLRLVNDHYYTERMDVIRYKSFAEQRALIRQIMVEEDIVRGKLDATGMGRQMAEELKAEFPQLEPQTFTDESKKRMVVNARKAFEQKKIQIPDDRELVSDIHAIRRQITPSNNVIFDVDKSQSGHGDRFWGMALALDAASRRMPIVEIF